MKEPRVRLHYNNHFLCIFASTQITQQYSGRVRPIGLIQLPGFIPSSSVSIGVFLIATLTGFMYIVCLMSLLEVPLTLINDRHHFRHAVLEDHRSVPCPERIVVILTGQCPLCVPSYVHLLHTSSEDVCTRAC